MVYGDGSGRDRWNRKIHEGATVWERQAIITIPDMRKMALTVKIHESQVKRISTGLSVNIKVDAEADKSLTGEVYKVGLLPDFLARRLGLNNDCSGATSSCCGENKKTATTTTQQRRRRR